MIHRSTKKPLKATSNIVRKKVRSKYAHARISFPKIRKQYRAYASHIPWVDVAVLGSGVVALVTGFWLGVVSA